MGAESAADRLAMLGTDDFGTAATISSSTVYGIFDDAYQTVIEATGEVATTAPQFLCRTADVSSVAQGNTITINSIAYKAISIESDGTGMTTIQLSRD